jgi:hypothetical protein
MPTLMPTHREGIPTMAIDATKPEPRLKTTVTLPESVIWLLRERRVQKRIASDSEAIETAIRFWYNAQFELPASSASFPLDFSANGLDNRYLTETVRKFILMLIAILSSGKDDAISAVQASLTFFYKYCGGALNASENSGERSSPVAGRDGFA